MKPSKIKFVTPSFEMWSPKPVLVSNECGPSSEMY